MAEHGEKTRVLFLGEMVSSHAQSWMRLLDRDENFDALGFGVPGSPSPAQSAVPLFWNCNRFITSARVPAQLQLRAFEHALKTFKPHVVHCFGAFPAGAFYRRVLERRKGSFAFVLQVRGGPDVYMNRFDPAKRAVLGSLFQTCDVLIADNPVNYEIAGTLGLPPNKCWAGGIAPGTGGVDLAEFADAMPPSRARRQVIWPKAYEGYESKGLSVLEAIKIAWPQIAETKFIFTATNDALTDFMNLLPADIRASIDVRPRIPRPEMLSLMKESRVVMAPSVLEGVPNSLYEAMAAQCVPVYSPLDTYAHLVRDGENFLAARNLYPEEIATSLVRALNDDGLADAMAERNLELVARVANRAKITDDVKLLYRTLAAKFL